MPIYEYRCKKCGRITSFLVLCNTDMPSCQHCGGEDLDRVLSGFRLVQSEGSRLNNFNTREQKGEDYYRDPKNIGLWAKKRARELGADLGDAFDEKVEKARSGKLEDLN